MKIILLILIYLLLLFSYTPSIGFFSIPSFFLTLITYIIFLSYFLGFFDQIKINKNKLNTKLLLNLSLIISAILALFYDQPIYSSSTIGKLSIYFLYTIAVTILIYTFYRYFTQGFFHKSKSSLLLLIIAIAIRLTTIIISPTPSIDVFEVLQKGSKYLLQGENPYSVEYNQTYKSLPADVFGYLPGIFSFTLPTVLLFNDARVSYIIVQIITFYLLIKLFHKNQSDYGQTLALLYLYHPYSAFITEQSWVEPIMNLLFTVFIYSVIKKRERLSIFSFGLLLASKQYIYLITTFFLFLTKLFSIKKITLSVIVFLLIVMPFFFWNRKDFIDNTIKYHLLRSSAAKDFKNKSLSVSTFIYTFSKKDLPISFLLLSQFLLLFIIVRKKNNTGLKAFTEICAFWFFSFFFLNQLTYINYFYQISYFLLMTILLELRNTNPREGFKS